MATNLNQIKGNSKLVSFMSELNSNTFNIDSIREHNNIDINLQSNLKGMQEKWKINNYYIKKDSKFCCEGLSEVVASLFASCISDFDFVEYMPCRILKDNGSYLGCYSVDFKASMKEEEITLNSKDTSDSVYELLKDKCDFNRFEKLFKYLGIDYSKLVSQFIFDALILNEDRHLSNVILLKDIDYRLAPCFDNGSALLSKSSDYALKDVSRDRILMSKPAIGKGVYNHLEFLSNFNFDVLRIDLVKLNEISKIKIPYYDDNRVMLVWDLLFKSLEVYRGVLWLERDM